MEGYPIGFLIGLSCGIAIGISNGKSNMLKELKTKLQSLLARREIQVVGSDGQPITGDDLVDRISAEKN